MKKLLLSLIRFYQRSISPAFLARCRYCPTCSRYAYEAITKYGAVKGGFLALKRLLRFTLFIKVIILTPFPNSSFT